MTLYRHKNTGFVVAAEVLQAGKPTAGDDPWAGKHGRPTTPPVTGDYALWWGGRSIKYMEKATFEAEYERL